MTLSIPNLPNQATHVATLIVRKKLHLTVLTAARTIYLGHRREEIESPLAFSPSGLPIADTSGTVEIEWQGDLWIVGAAANASVPAIAVQL